MFFKGWSLLYLQISNVINELNTDFEKSKTWKLEESGIEKKRNSRILKTLSRIPTRKMKTLLRIWPEKAYWDSSSIGIWM